MKTVFRYIDNSTNEFAEIDGEVLEATNEGLLLEKAEALPEGEYILVQVLVK